MAQKVLDQNTQADLNAQFTTTREVAKLYPTVRAAEAAGYRRAGPYSPGLGAHYTRFNGYAANADGVMDEQDLLNPMAIIYDGVEPDSKIAGFMYYSFSEKEPAGFVGGNDHWHYHTNVCVAPGPNGATEAPLGADLSVTQAQCGAVGGTLMPQTSWMTHVWTVPGYLVGAEHGGVFGEVNPALKCSDGSYYMLPQSEWPTHLTNVCRSAA
jgi:hypothetical protein